MSFFRKSRSFSNSVAKGMLLVSVSGLCALLVLAAGCASVGSAPKGTVIPVRLSEMVRLDPERMATISYTEDIEPLLNSRCVSCHACFDAPAQLKLASAAGVVRGASKQRVYNGARLVAAPPTRLGEDADTVEAWRELGFFSVLSDPQAATPQDRLDSSVFYQMLAMSRLRQLPQGGMLDGIVRDSHDIPQAPTLEEMPEYIQNFPHAGMPFYTYGLTEEEFQTFAHWVGAGAPVDLPGKELPPAVAEEAADWEALFNGDSPKDQLIARYLFEHLFAAHVYFSGKEEEGFFKIIRSSTPPGEEPLRIVTRRPNDPPGGNRVYYRLIPVHKEITRKNHIPFELSPQRMERWQELFWETDWAYSGPSPYGARWSQRPFDVFSAIPPASRNAFMLDHSFYFVLSFIRGPVCRGQLALNGIWDHFFVYFVDPKRDPASADADYMRENRHRLVLPVNLAGSGEDVTRYSKVRKKAEGILGVQNAYYLSTGPLTMEDVWQGDDAEDVPFMTVFRHFDTASVVEGFVGETPPYGWYVDYTLFERIYYLLVVNYDVFGPVSHQLSTRLYFDYLRYEGESNYLRLFPAEQRQDMFSHWYRGVSKGAMKKDYPFRMDRSPPAPEYQPGSDPRDQLRKKMELQLPLWEKMEMLMQFEGMYKELPQTVAPFVQYFPEVVFVRIRRDGQEDEVLTILRNKAMTNVAHLFKEGSRREPEEDTLLFVSGLVGDYPNLMLDLHESRLQDFANALYRVDSLDSMMHTWLTYGVLRTSPEFWPALDAFTAWDRQQNPVTSGRFDLKHYYLTRMLKLREADLVNDRDIRRVEEF